MKNDTALNSTTLELTQKIQLHFPRNLDPTVVQFWNGQSKEALTARLFETFGRIPELPTPQTLSEPKPQPPLLPMSITIDGDLNPNVPSDLYLTGEGTEHRKMGKVTLEKRKDGKLYANGKEVVRHLSPNQMNGKSIQGHKLRKELKDVQVPNACIMDALLANPQLIPDEWKTGVTYFWGTIFRHANGHLFVEYLYWSGGQWHWDYSWLGSDWSSDSPAASLAS